MIGMETNQWLPADKSAILTIVDSIRIGENGHVNITNLERNKKIPSLSIGVLSIGQIIKEAEKKESKSILEVLLSVLIKIKKKNGRNNGMSTIGAQQRGLILNDGKIRDLANCMAWIGKQVMDKQYTNATKELVLHRNITDDGVSFAIENATGRTYCVNVLHVNCKTQTPSLCYIVTEEEQDVWNVTIPPSCTYVFSEFVFPNTADDLYILVATEESYDTESLNNELLWNKIDNATKPVTMNVIYTW